VPEPPSGTVTFLFTDIEGSTRRWEEHSPSMAAAVERHLALLRSAVEANGGVLFKVIGDAIQAAFATAPQALAAAIAAQRAQTAGRADDAPRLRVRMALHTGEALPHDGDYLAPCLNRLARLLAAGFGEQLLLSQATQQLVRDHLPPDVQLRDLGVHQLRDLRESEQIFQVVAPGLRADFPPLRSLTPPRHTLPLALTPLIGREQELTEIAQRLGQETVRLLTLVGPGGVGKTRLAVQAAANVADAYEDGVHFVPLETIVNAELVMPAIVQALGLRELANQSARDLLIEYLAHKRLLLVLDNIEQVRDVGPLVTELLTACPGLQVLATGRAPLGVAGEHEVTVPSLAVPAAGDATSVDAIQHSAAVRLFVARAQAVKADFVLDQTNARAVAEICQRLDGLPLAIELAAARVKLLPPDGILRRLDRRLALLTGGSRDQPARQRTLRDTITWSYELLTQPQQALFARLAAFVGTWTLEAAEAVVADGDHDGFDMLDGIAALLDNNLVRTHESAADPEPGDARFAMLQTIHEFAAERLAMSDEERQVRAAHAAWYQQLGLEAEPQLNGSEAAAWLDRLEIEHDNLRGALIWLCQQRDAAAAVALAGALWRFWWARGFATEGRRLLEAALALAPATATTTRAAALDGAGVLAEIQGDYARASTLHEEALAAARAMDDRHGIARALANLGVVALDGGDGPRAVSLLEEGLALARTVGEASLTATILNDLAWVTSQRGDDALAERLYQESLILRQRIGNPVEIARSLNNLGAIAFRRGDYAQARRLYEESLVRYEEAGDRWGRAAVLNGLAETARAAGSLERAMPLYEESHTLFAATGDTRNAATVLVNIAIVERDGNDLAGATATYREALAAYRRLGLLPGTVACLAGLGGVARDRGELDVAARLLGAATGLAEKANLDLERIEAPRLPADIAALRTAMGEETFAPAWRAGQAMTIEEAILTVSERVLAAC
jgi:predicted ATPase/class 3 adenylate cyclase/Tfp pilus assembly protein PilF